MKTLLDYNNEEPITYLWLVTVGRPAGYEFRHNTENEEEYCDFAELDLLKPNLWSDDPADANDLWALEGDIVAGVWCWDGKGKPVDQFGSQILNLKASRGQAALEVVRQTQNDEYKFQNETLNRDSGGGNRVIRKSEPFGG